MRAYLPVVISVLLGAVVGGVLFLVPAARQSARLSRAALPQVTPQPPAASRTPAAAVPPGRAMTPAPGAMAPAPLPPTPTPAPLSVSGPPDGAGGDAAADALVTARGLVAAGRLREAQDEYVQVLLLAPDHEAAWRELVAVRRRLAGDDSALLRGQAAAYRRAIARGEETEEHYTVPAMRILAQASVRAAQEIEQGLPRPPGGLASSPIVLAATPVARPAVTPTPATPRPRAVRLTPRPRPTRRSTQRAVLPTARSVTPAASPALLPTQPPRTPSVIPTPDLNEPFYVVSVGPIADAVRASEIAGELTVAGFAARVTRTAGGTYAITLGPYRESIAETIVQMIRTRFGAGVPIAMNPAP